MRFVDVRLKISDALLEYLQNEAEQRNIPLDEVVSDVLAETFDEPSKAEILESIRDSLRDGLAGKFRPADEVLAELRRELGLNADNS